MTDEEIIAVVTAHKEGKQIQHSIKGTDGWCDTVTPSWNFFMLDYRVKQEGTYRTFKNEREAFVEAKKHGFWVKENECGYYHAITFIGSCTCYIDDDEYYYTDLLSKFVWADDGSKCGILEE